MTKIKNTFTFKGQGELLFVCINIGMVAITIIGYTGHWVLVDRICIRI